MTLNTLVKNHELESFFAVLSDAYLAGIDAIIIQHLSFLDIIKRHFPGLKVFMSTQAAVGNLSTASLVKSADRIILPRELPLDEVRRFVQAGIETEVFVHGALCFSYSGMCLFSSFVGNRSGNRGSCAQLCRQKYNGEYPLSTKELCLIRRIPELIEAGVKGFKIEGRMRSPLYVAVATRMYRKAIDSYLSGRFVLPTREMEEMEVVFNREFTEGFVFGETRLTSPQKPMNRGAFLGEVASGKVAVSRRVSVGDGIGVWSGSSVTGTIIKELYVEGRRVTSAFPGEKVSLGADIADGSRVYLTSCGRIKIRPGFKIERPPVPTPERHRPHITLLSGPPAHTARQAPTRHRTAKHETGVQLLVKAYSLEEAIEAARAGADMVFLDISDPQFPFRQDWLQSAPLGAYLPRIMTDSEISSALDLVRSKSPSAILAGNPGCLPVCSRMDVPVFLDYCCNAFNDTDILFFKKHGAIPVLSPELTLAELGHFKDRDAVILCHGDVVLVNTCINPGVPELVDEKGSRFRVRGEDSYWQILNSRPFGLFDSVLDLQKRGFSRFCIDWQGKAPGAVRLYRDLMENGAARRRSRKGFTSGHLFRPVM